MAENGIKGVHYYYCHANEASIKLMYIPLKINFPNFLWVLHYFYSTLTAGAIELKFCMRSFRVHIKKNPKY